MTLYIIGNGYDLNNGLKTRYSDFAEWTINKYPKIYKKISNLFKLDSLWSDFEDSIADSLDNIKGIIENEYESFFITDFNHEDETDIYDEISGSVKYEMDNNMVHSNELDKLMKEWITSIMIEYQKCTFINECIINFNFTNYLIGPNILPIHENVSSIMSLHIGHSRGNELLKMFDTVTPFGHSYPDPAHFYNQLSKYPNVSKEMLKGYLSNKFVTKIVFYGFSFGKQDEVYFSLFNKETEVEFYIYDRAYEQIIMRRISKYFNNVTFIDSSKWPGFSN